MAGQPYFFKKSLFFSLLFVIGGRLNSQLCVFLCSLADPDSSPTRKEMTEGDLQCVFRRRIYSSDKMTRVAGCEYHTVPGILEIREAHG